MCVGGSNALLFWLEALLVIAATCEVSIVEQLNYHCYVPAVAN
jgi:hypothetical protein